MNSILKGAIISICGASLSFGVAFSTQIKVNNNDDSTLKNMTRSNSTDDDTIVRKPLTPQQKFLNSLGGTQGFDVDADINVKLSETLSIDINGHVKGDASDMSDIKLNGNASINFSENTFDVNFSYFDSVVYFDFHDTYFKMDVDSITDFIKKLPEEYGLSINLPSSLSNFSLETFEQMLLNMPEKEQTSDGYVYKLNILNTVIINWKTNEEDEFLGLYTSLVYQGIELSIDVNLKHVDPNELELVSPLDGENKDKYQDFSPLFTIFDGIYNLTKKTTNTVNADIDIFKDGSDFISTSTDISYDLDNKFYSLAGNITTHSKTMPYGFALTNETIYADYSDLHVSMKIDSISKLVSFFSTKIGNDEFDKILNSITTIIENPNISEIIRTIDNGVGSISLTSDELKIGLIPSLASEKLADLDDITVTLTFSNNGISKIDFTEFTLSGYIAKVSLNFLDYKPYSLSNYDYQNLDPLASLSDMINKYSKQSQFAIEFDGKYVTSEDGVSKQLTIGNDKDNNPSFIQFTLDENRKILDENGNTNDNGFGYGEVSIVDYDGYLHNVKVDLKSVNEVLFSYNSTLNGKMKIQTLKDLYSLIKDITIDNPDDHMKEIVNKIFDSTTSLPLNEIINGDYTLLLTTNIINSLEVTETYIDMNISLDILSMSHVSFNLKIEYETGSEPSLKALKFSNLNIDGITENKSFEFNAYLKEYDVSKDTSSTYRLDRNANYIDFGDLKVLLQLGINTSKYNYYHFNGNAHLNLAKIMNKDLPLDIKVWSKSDDNHDSDVKIDINLTNIPTVNTVNADALATKSFRSAHIFYHESMFYVDRYEEETVWFRQKTRNYAGVYTTEYFFANVLKILLQDVMGINDTYFNYIEQSTNDNSNYQIPYEKVLKDFKYNESDHNFYFDLDIEALSGNSDLKTLTVTARADESNTQLTGVDVNLGIKVGISITLALSINLTDKSEVADDSNRLTDLETFEDAHKNDTINEFRQI